MLTQEKIPGENVGDDKMKNTPRQSGRMAEPNPQVRNFLLFTRRIFGASATQRTEKRQHQYLFRISLSSVLFLGDLWPHFICQEYP